MADFAAYSHHNLRRSRERWRVMRGEQKRFCHCYRLSLLQLRNLLARNKRLWGRLVAATHSICGVFEYTVEVSTVFGVELHSRTFGERKGVLFRERC